MAKQPKAKGKAQAQSNKARKTATVKKEVFLPASRAQKKLIDSDLTYIVSGTVTNADSSPAVGVTVVAFDKDTAGENRLGEATADAQGAYVIRYTEAQFRLTKNERGGTDVFVRIYNSQKELLTTSKPVRNAPVALTVNVTLPAASFVVCGMVSDASGKPAAGLRVCAFDRDLRWEEPLGETKTNQAGAYEIHYSREQFQRSEKHLADLVVRVSGRKSELLVASVIIFNADPKTVVNLRLPGADPRGLSEFDHLMLEITPLLRDVPLHELTEDDVTFLAADTSLERRYIGWLAESARRHIETDTIEPFAFYGLFRQGLPTMLNALLAQELAALRNALEQSSQGHVIQHLSSDDVDAIMAKFLALQANHATMPGDSGVVSSLGDLLRTVLSETEEISAVAELYLAHDRQFSEALFTELVALNQLSVTELTDTRLAFQLGELTGFYLPLVRELQRMAKTDSLYAPIGSLEPYARLTLEGWTAMLHRKLANGQIVGAPSTVPGDTIEEKIASYARDLSQQLQSAFPATTLVRRLEADSGDDSPFKDSHADLMAFLVGNPEFKLGTQPLDVYLSTDLETKLSGVKNPDVFTETLKGIQRVSKLTSDYAAMRALLTDGLHSAQAVLGVGEHAFVQRYAADLGGEDKARDIVLTAQSVHNTAMALYMKNAPAFRAPMPYVMGGDSDQGNDTQEGDQGGQRSWTTLFGSLELCECRHCRSLYSPAAYLVDTLRFISDAPIRCDATPLDNVLSRRPDIEYIELTCDNSNTPMPYIDVVNELLEARIAPRRVRLDWNAATVADLDREIVPVALVDALTASQYVLSDSSSVRVDVPGQRWTILDSAWAVVIDSYGPAEGMSGTAWPQTSWTAKDLKANPEHIHADAYNKLRLAVYPWRVPFHLPIAEARVYLQHLSVQRHEVMDVFLRGAAPDPLSDLQVACEYLGLTSEEADIVNGATSGGPTGGGLSSGPWNFWGVQESGNYIEDPADSSVGAAQGLWLDVLKRVSILLHQSDLTYRELLDLLDTHYINPRTVDGPNGRTLAIIASSGANPATCNTAKLTLFAIGDDPAEYAGAFGRMHRFVRLARTLGWAWRDLDKFITALKPRKSSGEIDLTNDFLVQVSHVQRLHRATRVPLVSLASFWADIDHAQYIDHRTDGEPIVASLYAQMFLSRTVAALGFPENPLQLSNKQISQNVPAIAAAFGIGADDVDRLRLDPYVIAFVQNPAQPAEMIPDDSLTLGTLSQLYRHALLARMVGLPLRSYLATLRLITNDPFGPVSPTLNTASTAAFVAAVERILKSGVSVADLDYVLRHSSEALSAAAVTPEEVASVLEVLREDLGQIAAENIFVDAAAAGSIVTSDHDGEVTRRKLAALGWRGDKIDTVVAVLNDSFVFEAELTSLDSAIRFPSGLADRIRYDAPAQRLRCRGSLSSAAKAELLAPPNHASQSFRDAVQILFDAPKLVIQRQMRHFSVPVFEVALQALPAGLRFPNSLANKVYYESEPGRLRFIDVMTEPEQRVLLDVSTDADFRAAIVKLFDAALAAPLDSNDQFLTATDTNDLFDNSTMKPPQRFRLVLSKLLPYVSARLSEHMVIQRVAEQTGLDARTLDGLLNEWMFVAGTTGLSRPVAMTTFVDPEFTASNSGLPVTAASFPKQFATYLLLRKIAALIGQLAFSPELVSALFEHGATASWPDLNTLPLTQKPEAYALFAGWSRLADLAGLSAGLPNGEVAVREWLAAAYAPSANTGTVLAALSRATQWNRGDLDMLSSPAGFDLNLGALRSEKTVMRLHRAMFLLKRLGATAAQCLAWTRGATSIAAYTRDQIQAREIISLVRAKYDTSQWLEVAGALRDPLREQQRAALVDYLLSTERIDDANALYAELLIDVEMGPCMLTTRIKQAISSVQLYVQRTLMNLEVCAELTADQAKQWAAWRKQYRVWEANRKVLLYPENWIEPGLRDDKTPFFTDLENELLQNDLTADVAEEAFIHYLEKLDHVARLDIVGFYEARNETTVVVHVFGRTLSVPHLYFYRRLEHGAWTPWEKVELDIEGDHLIPVVWNRRLYLFWAVFTEKTDQPTKDQRIANEDPLRYREIKFAWSEYKNKGWSPKKVSKEPLRHDLDPSPDAPQKLRDYSFKTRIFQSATGGQLRIECYGTTVTPTPSEVRTKTVPTTGVVTTNTQWIVRYYLAQNQHPYWYWLKFGKDGWNHLQPSEIDDIKILVKSSVTGDLYETLKLDANGSYPSFGAYVEITEPVDFYLESTKKQLKTVTDKWWFVGGLGVSIDLKAWVPPATTTTEEVPGRTTYNPLQGLGEFALDDCRGNLVLVQEPLAMVPSRLEPIQGTDMQGMEMVEGAFNGLGALGAMAVLGRTPGAGFRLLLPHQGYLAKKFSFPFFFQDQFRTYYVPLQNVPSGGIGGFKLRFNTFYHPRTCALIQSLKRDGVEGLLTLAQQRYTDSGTEFLQYSPNTVLVDLDSSGDAIPQEDIDFRDVGAYSQYNWELFFHVPFLIATQLSKNQRFEEAQKWFHYIFDPTATVASAQGPERFWKVLPFFREAARGVHTLEELLADSATLERQVNEAAAKPFNPHAIARMRIAAYMKTVVMHYLDNLLAWGDQLFGRDTIESINEATQLYILAAEILGKRPESVVPRMAAQVQTYSTLYDSHGPDSLSNALVDMEEYIFPSAAPAAANGASPTLGSIPYFCTSPNDKLLGYWDLIADRLFSIRHCMNIAGVERLLPIYEPPIDPALLVRAAAAGVDLASALSEISAVVPHYRFGVMQQKAAELCSDVKALGGALLSALEKRDAEALALLRSGHEIDVLKAVRQVKEQQVKEANANLEGLNAYQKVVMARQQYYQSRTFMNPFEVTQLALAGASLIPTAMQLGADITAAVLHLIPNTKGGAPTTMGVTFGGQNVASAVQAFGSAAGITASMLNAQGAIAATLGGHYRRQEEWTHQADVAAKELKQVDQQIAAAEIRLAMAERELQNHDLQVEHSQEVDAFMRAKFSNRELYSWMVGQLSAVYFQSYQLAYAVAKRAERAYRFELGVRDSSFIQFGYWDSLKSGLLSGERLHYDLKRMDVSYLEQNQREHEITKHISLAAIDPLALAKLKETQSCFVSLPEVLFDLDYPGHYLRRIKSVSLSIPCVTGPYAGVHCTLTLLNSTIRHSRVLQSNQYERQAEDVRFVDSLGATQAIVTSSGQNDSGLFETNLRDERFLPFEGAGAISEWRIQLPDGFWQFDYSTISDVILHVRYTARAGGDALKEGADAVVRGRLNALRQIADGEAGLVQMLSLRQLYSTEWSQLRSSAGATTVVTLNKAYFPYMMAGETLTIIRVGAIARVRTPVPGQAGNGVPGFSLTLTKTTGNPASTVALGFPDRPNLGDARTNVRGGEVANGPVTVSDDPQHGGWTLRLMDDSPAPGALGVQHRALLDDIILLVGYRITA